MLTSGTNELKRSWDTFVDRHPYLLIAAALAGAGFLVKVKIDRADAVNQTLSACVDKGGKPQFTTNNGAANTIICNLPAPSASAPQ